MIKVLIRETWSDFQASERYWNLRVFLNYRIFLMRRFFYKHQLWMEEKKETPETKYLDTFTIELFVRQ